MDTIENELLEAVTESKTDVVQSLIKQGVNINYCPLAGQTPLATAAALGKIQILRLLLSADKANHPLVQEDIHTVTQVIDPKWMNSLSDDKENLNNRLALDNAISNNSSSLEHKRNLGYYIIVHNDDTAECGGGLGDVNKNENLDAETPEGMDDLEWDVEVDDGVHEVSDDVWSSQYRWYANILDKTGSLVEDTAPGCDINLQDYLGRCALHYAVEFCQIEAVHCLLSAGCNVNIGDGDSVTPIHMAAMKDHLEIAKLLIVKGAKVNVKTVDKMTPLHYAAVKGFAEMVTLLLGGGAPVDPLDSSDRTPLMLAVTRRHTPVVEILIENGARVNIEEIHGCWLRTIPKQLSCTGYTPLCEAVWSKSVEMAQLLLKAGAKLTQSHHLLHYSVLHRQLPMAELLLTHGAYPNLRDDAGDTPLLKALHAGHYEMIQLLLRFDANPNCAIHVAPLHMAVDYEVMDLALFEDVLKLMCKHNVELDLLSCNGRTALVHAILGGHMDKAAALVRAGADVNKHYKMPYSESPMYILDLAICQEMYPLAYLLVAAGYDMSKYKASMPQDLGEEDVTTMQGWLTHMKFTPRRLMDQCRVAIRRPMGAKAMHLVPRLEIPSSLKEFLMYEEFRDVQGKSYGMFTRYFFQ